MATTTAPNTIQGYLGAKADALKAAMQKFVGETLRLKVKRGADASQDVSLIAGPKPPS